MTDAILGSYWTLAAGTLPLVQEVCDHDFRARVEAASKAGYTGMGFWHSDLENILKSTDFAEMRRILTGNGIVHIEVEWLNDWYYRDDRRAESDRQRALLLDAAEGLGAHHIKGRRPWQRRRSAGPDDGGIRHAMRTGCGAGHRHSV